MSHQDDVTALIEMLEKIVIDCASSDRTASRLAQVECLVRLLRSGQAEPELVAALLEFNRAAIAQSRSGQRRTDTSDQSRAGLTARGMSLADAVLGHLSPVQRDRIQREVSGGAGEISGVSGRHN